MKINYFIYLLIFINYLNILYNIFFNFKIFILFINIDILY